MVAPDAQAPLPRIYMISSGEEISETGIFICSQLQLLPENIPVMLQIREKHFHSDQIKTLLSNIADYQKRQEIRILLNTNIHGIVTTDIDGIHIPDKHIMNDTETSLGNKILGYSAHDESCIKRAENHGASYIIFSPIFDTPSKRIYGKPQGLRKLKKICSSTKLPVYALGGISLTNAHHCLEAGAYGIAGISLFKNLETLHDNLKSLHAIIKNYQFTEHSVRHNS